jgi:hypothetical protein
VRNARWHRRRLSKTQQTDRNIRISAKNEPVIFRVTLKKGSRMPPWFLVDLAIHRRSSGWYVVTHRPTGCRLTEFNGLASRGGGARQ